MQPTSPPDVEAVDPASATILTNSLVGEDLGNLPAVSSPLNCLFLLANSLGEAGVLLLPTLGITFIHAI